MVSKASIVILAPEASLAIEPRREPGKARHFVSEDGLALEVWSDGPVANQNLRTLVGKQVYLPETSQELGAVDLTRLDANVEPDLVSISETVRDTLYCVT